MGQFVDILRFTRLGVKFWTVLIIVLTVQLTFFQCTNINKKDQKFIQIPEPDGLYYYPYRVGHHHVRHEGAGDQPIYFTSSRDELGNNKILLNIKTGNVNHGSRSNILLQRNRYIPHLFVYSVVEMENKEKQVQGHEDADAEGKGISAEMKPIDNISKRRSKRSPQPKTLRKILNSTRDALESAGRYLLSGIMGGWGGENEGRQTGAESVKKVIHVPALFIDEEKDGFENIFYRDMIVSALCLTNQPELDRHEIRDEYEARVCNKKGYAAILPEEAINEARKRSIERSGIISDRKKREDVHYKDHDADRANWQLDKNKYDILWKNENISTSSSTQRSVEPEIVEDLNYDYYEFHEDDEGNGTSGWEEHEVDPEDLDFIGWPAYLPVAGEEKVNKSDQLRSKLHNHPDRNYTLPELYKLLQENHTQITFDRRKFALNDSTFLSDYYTSAFHLWSYNYEGLIKDFFTSREQTLSSFYASSSQSSESKLTLEFIRQLFILYIIDVHHVNCFNRHIRFYGYVMKRPASINGDEITNNGRLTRGIIMRALELLRHVPQYNMYKELFLRMLIASLKERAATSKHSTKLVEENDYTELFEVASYLEYLLKNGIHPDEKNQDLFVQETRFYAHHFMNTLTL